jgi:hypothetical protein
MVRKVDNFDLRGAFNYLVEDQDEGGLGLTRPQAESQIAQRLAKETDFDYTAATEAGFNNEQIISKLTGIEDRGALSVLGEATARGAIGAIPSALTFVPGVKAGAALGTLGGPAGVIGGGILGGLGLPLLTSIVDQQVGLTKSASDFLLGEEEPVLPSDQPFREAGKVTGGVLSFSAALRRGLAKSALGDVPTGQAGATLVDTGADFGSKKILANLRKYDPDAKTPLSLRALQGAENIATRMATRARAPGRDYYLRQEVPIATAFGLGAGIAEQVDPGDAMTSFFSSLGAGLVAPISPLSRIVSGAAAKSAQAGQALKSPRETLSNIAGSLSNKAESKARNDLIKIYDALAKQLDDPSITPAGAAEVLRAAREAYGDVVPGTAELMTPATTPFKPEDFIKVLPVLQVQAQVSARNPDFKDLVSRNNQEILYLSDRMLQDALEVGEPGLIASHVAQNQKEQERVFGQILHNRFKTITETLDKAEAKGKLEPGEGSEIVVREINKLRDIARDIETRLFSPELIDYSAAVKPVNLIKALNELESGAQLTGRLRPSDIKSAEGRQVLELIEEITANIPKADPTLQRPPKTTTKAKRKSTAIPSILKPGIEPKVPRLRDIVRNIDPDFDEMSELVSSMGSAAQVSRKKDKKTGRLIGGEMLPSNRMKRGGEKSIDGLLEKAIGEGYFPGYGTNEFTAGPAGVLSRDEFYGALEANIARDDDQLILDEYLDKVAIADSLQKALDKAGIKNKDIRGRTDDEIFELVADIESGILPPKEIREQVGGFPKDMPAKERRRLRLEQEKAARVSSDQIQYDPDTPLQVMTVGDAIRIRSLIGDRVRDLAKDDKGRSEQRLLKLIREGVEKDLSNPDLTEPALALIRANTFTKAKNDVFSRTLGGDMANKLKYSDENVFIENLLSASRPNEVGNRITGLQKFGSFFEDQATELVKVGDPELTVLVERVIPVSQNSAKTIENSMVEVIRGMLLNGVIEPKPQSTLIPSDIKKALPGEFEADQLVVNSTKLKTFMNKYKVAADQNPMIKELFDDMSDPVKAQQVLQGLKRGEGIPEKGILRMEDRIAEKNMLSDIFGVDSPVFRITQILESRQPETKLNALIKQVNLMKTSNIPVVYKGKKIPAKEAFEPAANGLLKSVIQVARERSYVPRKEIYGGEGLDPISFYDAKIYRQVFFDTGKVFPAMEGQTSIADTLLKQGIINKAKYDQINDVTLGMERIQNQQMFMERLPEMSDQPPNILKRFAARFFGAQVGARLGTMAGGRGTIQIPGFAAGVADDFFSKAPNTAFISFMSELFEPGGYKKFLEMLEATAEESTKRQRGQAFETPLLVPPLKDSPLAVAAPVEAITRDREEERAITPPPPRPMSQASPSVNPMQTANQRARYAAMFPLDPASSLIRERQAQGIGSLPRP